MSFQPRSSIGVKPWGRIAGLAVPLRASSPDDREAYLTSFIATSPSLANYAPAETGSGTLSKRMGHDPARRRKHGAAEILLQAICNIIPQFDDFLGRAAIRIDFHHG